MPSATSRIVYSALFGGYEAVQKQPLATTPGYTFVLYTDRPMETDSGWTVRQVAPRFPTDPVRSARHLKIRGEGYVHEFDESLWVDNRVVLRGDLDRLFGLRGSADIAIPIHSYRGRLIEEFEAVIDSGFDDPSKVRQMYRLAQHFGVLDQQALWTGMLLRGRSDRLRDAMQRWEEFLLLTTRRDQLSLHCALAAADVTPSVLDIDNYDSPYHQWISPEAIGRSNTIRFWKPDHRRASIVLADGIRRSSLGRAVSRRLDRIGIPLPRL